MLGLAILVGADADMAAARDLGAGAADAAVAVPAVPVGHAARVGEDRTLAREQQRADLAQIDELAHLAERHLRRSGVAQEELEHRNRKGILFAAGMITGEALMGIGIALSYCRASEA